MKFLLRSARALVPVALVAFAFPSLQAQRASLWHGSASANATVLFGATSQRVIASTMHLERSDSTIEASVGLQYKYGEAADVDGNHFVSARSWLVPVAVDLHPYARLTPFAFGTAESSLQKQIRRRYSGGAGGKWTFTSGERGSASISLALLGERTTSLADGEEHPEKTSSLARWSWRIKGKRKVQERLTLEHVTFYQPVFNNAPRYTVSSTSEIGYKITQALALKLSLIDTYDTDAVGRGARSNTDGQFLVGLQASF